MLIATYRSVIISLADIFNNITTLKSILRRREKPFINISLKQPAVMSPVVRERLWYRVITGSKEKEIY
uniref:Uncharacterized protein n=1 Tax=Klebsiella pneumoniae TaxID=573 RepID=A0A6H1PSU1_KLEPN|nr:hypothetical protein [Klebsiella pneumoniae]